LPLPKWARWSVGWLLIRVGAPKARRRNCEPLPDVDRIDVCVFVNDEAQWTEFRESLQAAGFQDPVRLSDRDTDPYETITWLGQGDGYSVLCHQDVRFDQGLGEQELRAAINSLSARDPCWTVAGNAGVRADMSIVWDPEDKPGGPSGDELPARVVSLDENFLILNRNRSPRCSRGLSGFHFYGTDVCLNAFQDGGTAYVLDTRVTHLSHGQRDSSYYESQRRFVNLWDRQFRFRYLGTTTTALFMSRWGTLRRIFGSRRALAWVSLHLHDRY
jgi:hypothetical protein